MGQTTKIEWCDHTFNPWSGCTKVSEGCANCYAADMAHRFPGNNGSWGPNGRRRLALDHSWDELARWNAKACASGVKRTVFCLSMGDFWEDRPDLIEPRARLLRVAAGMDSLVFLTLTKRPENAFWAVNDSATRLLPDSMRRAERIELMSKVWLGASIENQPTAVVRTKQLLQVPARGHFLSAEPMLGNICLRPTSEVMAIEKGLYLASNPFDWPLRMAGAIGQKGIRWVICGGESGPHARPMNPEWPRNLLQQCRDFGCPFFFKQWGEWVPYLSEDGPPSSVRLHRFPDGQAVYRVGKKAAGALLDGRLIQELPQTW